LDVSFGAICTRTRFVGSPALKLLARTSSQVAQQFATSDASAFESRFCASKGYPPASSLG